MGCLVVPKTSAPQQFGLFTTSASPSLGGLRGYSLDVAGLAGYGNSTSVGLFLANRHLFLESLDDPWFAGGSL